MTTQAHHTTTSLPRQAYRTHEVADMLGLNPAQVRGLIRSGMLRARSTGSTYIIPAAALDDYLNGADEPMTGEPT